MWENPCGFGCCTINPCARRAASRLDPALAHAPLTGRVGADRAAQGVWWVVLSWVDPTAKAAIEARTQQAAQAAAAALSAGSPQSSTCGRFCDSSGLIETGCCDTIWLPHVNLPNLIELPEASPPSGLQP